MANRQFIVESYKILTDAKRGEAGTMQIDGADWRHVFVTYILNWNSRGLLKAIRKSHASKRQTHVAINDLPSEVVLVAKLLLKTRKKTLEEKQAHITMFERAKNTSEYLH